jgi:hypothetical protein
MSFKQASKLKLRFHTGRGLVSAEQLWDLPQTTLADYIKSLKKTLKETDADDELSFLTDAVKTNVDTENQLRFEIAKDIFLTKKAEAEALRDAKALKERKQKLVELIAQKEDAALGEKSVEDLKKELEALG